MSILIFDTDKNKTRLMFVLGLLVQCNRVAESDVDEILRQHSEYTASMIDKEQDHIVNFDPVKSIVDILMHETMAGKTCTASCGMLSECCLFFHTVKQL